MSDAGARDPAGIEVSDRHDAVAGLDRLALTIGPDDDLARALQDAYRRLRPDGTLVLTVRSPQGAADRLVGRLVPGRQWVRRGPRWPDVANALFRHGFERPRLTSSRASFDVVARRSRLAPPGERTQRLSIVMPVYNEHATFRAAMDAVVAKSVPGMDIEIVVVESNSTDGTREIVQGYAARPGVRLVFEDRPQGKGHAVRTGLAHADGDFVLIQDADLEYDVEDYDKLLEPLRAAEAGFVLGIRTGPTGSSWRMRDFGQHSLVSRIMNVGHVLFLALFNAVYGQHLRDPFTMYKLFRRDCIHGMRLECDRFDFDWELTGKLIRAGYAPVEIPIIYRSRSYSEGKKVSFLRDPITWVVACFKYRFAKLYD